METFDAFVIASNLAPIHCDPDAQSEMVTQALMNTPVTVGECVGEWTAVTLPDYAGWVRTTDLEAPIVRGYCDGEGVCGVPLPFCVVVTVPCTPFYRSATGDEIMGEIYLSTVLPYIDLDHPQRICVALPGEREAWLERRDVDVRNNQQPFPRQPLTIVSHYARLFLHRPYLWGGTGWPGVDCSGLVQLCYRMAGDLLPRDAEPQHDALTQTVSLAEMQEGDLIFFGRQRITHVALALNQSEYIHAEGQQFERVVIHSIDPLHPAYHEKLAGLIWNIKRVRT